MRKGKASKLNWDGQEFGKGSEEVIGRKAARKAKVGKKEGRK